MLLADASSWNVNVQKAKRAARGKTQWVPVLLCPQLESMRGSVAERSGHIRVWQCVR